MRQYDGDTLYSSLGKEKLKEKYQRDSSPLESELQDIEKGNDFQLIPFMAKEPGLEIKTQTKGGVKNPMGRYNSQACQNYG